ncbi:uncharacterized protein PV09_03605 [Verruconis gallopava]|uniref:RNA helicase n=1 Tax=Verruconis gallopava TaxID=253628 RepID=A0A0D2B365_9PEZI|nr:uncharacterized protein PV09_03605 [Verruconis gallopava]KIW05749.1 hypothetical protein PV09_03605 [Verruconis gallopava]
MAKKKKPAANPARGFATTSVASKPKTEKVEKDIPTATASKFQGNDLPKSDVVDISHASGEAKEKELHDLTPEEMTEQLERNELQLLVETYGPKVRREVAKLESKLRADSRVLRSQAQPISLRKWLPEELMTNVLDIIKKEREELSQTLQAQPGIKLFSEEDMLFRCWTLWEALVMFGIATDDVKRVLGETVKRPPRNDAGGYVWGFREALDLLALDLEEEKLPSYDARKSRALQNSETSSTPTTAFNTPVDSQIVTPESSPKPNSRAKATDSVLKEDSESSSDVSASDFDSDIEPDDLVATYLSIKERLYRHRPELVETRQPKSKRGKQQQPALTQQGTKPNERRLQMKMKSIESDMLFDKHEAEQRWTMRRIQIMQEVASVRNANQQGTQKDNISQSEAGENASQSNERTAESNSSEEGSEQEAGEMLGNMFATTDGEKLQQGPSEPDVNTSVSVRDMGNISGLSPRRVLEDVCRGRDSRATVHFRLISKSTYISRHSVVISWSVDQERISTNAVPYITIEQQPSSKGPDFSSSISFSMTGIANPDPKQSEGFIATIALFYITNTSQKEEKQYQKLPPNFRDLYGELLDFQKQQSDAADREKLRTIRDMIIAHSQEQEDDGIVLSSAFRNRGLNSPRPGSSRGISPSLGVPKGQSRDCIQLWNNVQNSARFQQMLSTRMNLPMFGFKHTALSAIDQSQVIILCGETGCGKSTQLPSYVLENELSHGRECKIYCTQPRRISAISLAQRVSEEMGELPGDVGTARSLVGYAVRLESKVSAHTRLVYATVGVVLRMLESSRSLDDITHLIIDEVHERSIDTDFLLIVLKSLMIRRPELKVILMSATVDATRFSQYLNNAPIINVPGRTFPVQTKFLEDAIELTGFSNADVTSSKHDNDDGFGDVEIEGGTSGIPKQLQGYSAATLNALSHYDEYRIDFELIVRLLEKMATDPAYTSYSKATLVFLPGIAEIRELNDLLTGSSIFQTQCWVIPLHSSIASEEQQLAFRVPPAGVRKVVLATNIAETGITIPDVTCVIDTGKHKEMRHDERRQLSRLIQSFISRANAKQRRGRAGRVQEGLCFHLFTKYRHDELMAEQQTPEMLRLSLQDLVMRVKICGLGQIEETLAQALDPPMARNVRRAIDALIEVGALTSNENLTTLGSQLAKLPLDANLGKLCLFSAIFGCLDVGLTISSILSSKSPFVTPFGDRQRADNARLGFAKGDSDLLTAYNAYSTWRRICQTPNQSVHAFCRKMYLSHQNLSNIEELKGQLLTSLADTGLVSLSRSQLPRLSRGRQAFVQVPIELDINSNNETIVSSVIAWSFYPKLLIRDGRGYRNIANSQQVSLHPASVNKGKNDLKFLSYYSMMASSSGNKNYNALSTSAVADVPVMLLAGDAEWRLHAGFVVIDGNRLRFKVDQWKEAITMKYLRIKIEELVESRLKEPLKEISGRAKKWFELWDAMCKSYNERTKQ